MLCLKCAKFSSAVWWNAQAPVARKQNVTVWAAESIEHTVEILAMSPAAETSGSFSRPLKTWEAPGCCHHPSPHNREMCFIAAGGRQERLHHRLQGAKEDSGLFYCDNGDSNTVSAALSYPHAELNWSSLVWCKSAENTATLHMLNYGDGLANPEGYLKGEWDYFLCIYLYRGRIMPGL